MPDLRRLDEEVDELMGSGVPTTRGTSACASEKKSVRGAAARSGTSGEAGDSRGETCDTQTQQCLIGE